MVGYVGGAGGSFDYVQDAEPSAPLKGESWYDTDANGGDGEVKVYDGSSWNITGFTSHGDLTGITVDAHHSPVTVSTPLTEDGTQGLDLSIGDGLGDVDGALAATLGNGLVIDANGNVAASLGNGLTIDGSGRVSIPAGAVDTNELAADAVTTAKVAANAVTNALLATDAVDTAQIANAAVTAARIASDAVTGAKIASGAVDSGQIANGAVRHGTEADTPADAHHARYSDSEARTAVDGANVSIAGDADTVDGLNASEIPEPDAVYIDFARYANSPDSITTWTNENDMGTVRVLPFGDYSTMKIYAEWTDRGQFAGSIIGIRFRDITNGVTLASDTSGSATSGTLDTTISIPSGTGVVELQAINDDNYGGVNIYDAQACIEQ